MINLSQSFHQLKNMDNCYRELIFGIIERINMQVSMFYHICHRPREFDVLLIHWGIINKYSYLLKDVIVFMKHSVFYLE